VTPRAWLLVAGVVLFGCAALLAVLRGEGSPPQISAPESAVVGLEPTAISIDLDDVGAGLRQVRVVLAHAGGEVTLLDEHYAGNWLMGGSPPQTQLRLEVPVNAAAVENLGDEAILRITASDWSLRGLFGGNQVDFEVRVTIDLVPPRIQVASGLTYVTRGGAGAVVYKVSEPTREDGVRVGEATFRGYPIVPANGAGDVAPAGDRIALFAVPVDGPPKPVVRVFARDAAGNRATAEWPAVVKERVLPEAQVTLPPSFMSGVVRGLAQELAIKGGNPAAKFHKINTDVRRANELEIRRTLSESAPEPLWNGAFEQMRNSRVTSRFGEKRRYFVNGTEVSKAWHLGYDLASTKASPITAANAGRVVFARNLGIYGNCVLIDHGLGLASLYGHLSRIDVAVGDRVAKGDRLGLSGMTGLAGGDHLHFAILVGDSYVDPLEWWDPKWVRTHIEDRLVRSSP
jgi:murein DD-endopeptidase MepM/ murein hydrolase activator NlpD